MADGVINIKKWPRNIFADIPHWRFDGSPNHFSIFPVLRSKSQWDKAHFTKSRQDKQTMVDTTKTRTQYKVQGQA